MTRREAREQAFILLFEKSFNDDMTINEIISAATDAELAKFDDFAVSAATKACDNMSELDEIIEHNLRGWKMNRISRVSLALLRLAVCEMLYFDDIPRSVSINEAVELCKTYGDTEDYSFVNGVLGSAERAMADEKGKD